MFSWIDFVLLDAEFEVTFSETVLWGNPYYLWALLTLCVSVYYRFGDVCDDSPEENRPSLGKVVCSMLRRSFVSLRAGHTTGSAGKIIVAFQITPFGKYRYYLCLIPTVEESTCPVSTWTYLNCIIVLSPTIVDQKMKRFCRLKMNKGGNQEF